MIKALQRAEFSSSEVDDLLQVVAGLLHLSNVFLTEDQRGLLKLQDAAAENALSMATLLLGLKATELQELLRCRRINLKGDVYVKRRNKQQSISARCSLIKFIYSRLFDYIVYRLNESVARQMLQRPQDRPENERERKSVGSKLFREGSVLMHKVRLGPPKRSLTF